MPDHSHQRPRHWRKRAEEARVHAEQLANPEARRMMLKIAEDYEKLGSAPNYGC
jgi:hypothetical protein